VDPKALFGLGTVRANLPTPMLHEFGETGRIGSLASKGRVTSRVPSHPRRTFTTFYKSCCPETVWPAIKPLAVDNNPVDVTKPVQVSQPCGIVIGPRGDPNVIRFAQLFCDQHSEAVELTADSWKETLARRLGLGRRMGFWTHDPSILKNTFFHQQVLPNFHIKVILIDTDVDGSQNAILTNPFSGGRRTPDDLLTTGAELADHRITVTAVDDPMSWFMAINTHETFVEHAQSTRGLPNTKECVGEPGQRFSPDDPIAILHPKPVPHRFNKRTVWNLAQSTLNGLAPDAGIFMPNYIKIHSVAYLRHAQMTYAERLARLLDVQHINMRTSAIDTLVEKSLRSFNNLPTVVHHGLNAALEPAALRPYVRPTSATAGAVDKSTMRTTEQDCFNTSNSSTHVLELFHGPTGTQGDVTASLLLHYIREHVLQQRVGDRIFLTKPSKPLVAPIAPADETGTVPNRSISRGVSDRYSDTTVTLAEQFRKALKTDNPSPALVNIAVVSSDELALAALQVLSSGSVDMKIPSLLLVPRGALSAMQRLHLLELVAKLNRRERDNGKAPLARIFEIDGTLEFVHALQRRLLQEDPNALLSKGYASLALDDTSPMTVYGSLSYFLSAYADMMRLGRVPVLDPSDIPVRGVDAYLTPRALYELDVKLSQANPEYPKPKPHDASKLSDVMVAANVPCGGPVDFVVHSSQFPLLAGALFASAYNLPVRSIIIACDDTPLGRKLHAFFSEGVIPTFTLRDLEVPSQDEEPSDGVEAGLAARESGVRLSMLAPAIERMLTLITGGDYNRIQMILTRMFNEIHLKEFGLTKYVVPNPFSSTEQGAAQRSHSLPSIPLHGPRLDQQSIAAMRNIIRSVVVPREEIAVTMRMDLTKANRLLTPEDAACKVAADKVKLELTRQAKRKAAEANNSATDSTETHSFSEEENAEIEAAAAAARDETIKKYDEKLKVMLDRTRKQHERALSQKKSKTMEALLASKISQIKQAIENEKQQAITVSEESAKVYKRTEILQRHKPASKESKPDEQKYISGSELVSGEHDVPVVIVAATHPVRAHDRIARILAHAPEIKESPSETELSQAFDAVKAREDAMQKAQTALLQGFETVADSAVEFATKPTLPTLNVDYHLTWDPLALAQVVKNDLRFIYQFQARDSDSNALPAMHPQLARVVDAVDDLAQQLAEDLSQVRQPLIYRFAGNLSAASRVSEGSSIHPTLSAGEAAFVQDVKNLTPNQDRHVTEAIIQAGQQYLIDYWAAE